MSTCRRIATFAAAGLAMSGLALGDDILEGPIEVTPVTQSHPRLFVTAEALIAAREHIRNGDAPWRAAYDRLIERVDQVLASERVPRPYTGDQGHTFFYATVWRRNRSGDGYVARDLALAYALSGKERYAEAALRFLLEWTNAIPTPGVYMDPYATPHGEAVSGGVGSVVARGIIPFAYAFDLLYDHPSMTERDRERVQSWFAAASTQIKRGVRLWEENDYFNRQDYQNHLVAHVAGLATIGYAIGDEDLVQFALDHPDNPRDFRELLQGTIFMAGDTPHHREKQFTDQPAQTGEIYDRYRHFTARAGIPRGLQYAHLSLKLLTLTAEVAFHNGLNLYRYRAETGESLRLPYDFYADFYRTRDSTLKGGFYEGESERIGKAGDSTGLFEIALARYPDHAGLRDLIQQVDRTSQEHSTMLLGPTVLTHGIAIDSN